MGVIFTESQATQIVQEMYFGKTDDILEMEKILHDIRSDYKVEPEKITKYNYFANITRDRRLVKFANKISEIWGFEECSVNVYLSEYSNAYTYPVTYSLDVEPEKMIVKGKNGYKYSKESKFYTMLYISSALLCNSDYTDGEVMAVLLHEIGHSFTAASRAKCDLVSAYRDSYIFNSIIRMIQDPVYAGDYALRLVANTNMYKRVMAYLNNHNKDGKDVYVQSDDVAKFIRNFWKLIVYFPFQVTGLMALMYKLDAKSFENSIAKNSRNEKYMKSLADRRTDEYLADSFSMMYGYGADQSSALVKLYNEKTTDAIDDFYDKIPLIGKLNQTSKFSYWVAAETFSVHPSLPARVDNITKELNNELKKSDLPPKMKAQIKKNIEDLEKMKEEVRNTPVSKSDTEALKKEWIKKWISATETPDIRNKFEEELKNMKDRDDYYNKLNKEK